MAKDEPKPYRDDERAAIDRAAELERELEKAPHTHSSDEPTRPGRKEIEAQLAATWARQFDTAVHRGAIVRVAPRPRWAPQAEDVFARAERNRRILIGVVLLVLLGVGGVVYWMRGAEERRIKARNEYCGAHPEMCLF